ncbi:Cyclic nucleotide-gated cation channel [Hondaea fermentalgiana]|uniref:Cyclic nucleotide-gated cation channel n=1 Tax=Hondaea fermentalgiana TaxID=2315210 RepID=A0A2R5GMQ3_9STRA|nr:Cyclic nucleotide-gated cation channel [Hondaea fermentalgiana]|eukprot:GBG32167.1 Cyclic nucleotide-gated cation channel [Hondaea fermentalgiana]
MSSVSGGGRRRSIAYEMRGMVHMPTIDKALMGIARRRSSETTAPEEKIKVAFDGYKTYQYFEFPDINPLKLRAMTSLESIGTDGNSARQLALLRRFLVSHRSSTRRTLIRICAFASFYSAMSTPAFVAFGYTMELPFKVLQALVYLVFWVDIVFSFNSTYQAQTGNDVTDHMLIARNYLETWFVVDFLAALPFSAYQTKERLSADFELSWNREEKHMPGKIDMLQLTIVFVKFLREAIRTRRIGFVKYPAIGNAATLLSYLFILIQVLTVLLFIACQTESSRFYQDTAIGEYHNFECDSASSTECDIKNAYFVRYVVYLHYATVYILGKGDPTCTAERLYALFVNVLGLFFTATVVGQVTHLIQQGNAKVTKWRAKMEEVNDSMLQMGISPDLQKRITNYYAFSWAVNGGEDKNFRWLEDLSKGYHEEAAIQVNENLIASVPIFRVADRAFVHAIIMKLQQQLYLPGDYIIKHGEIGDEMYFVVKGTVQAMNKTETVLYTVLSEGSFFGEIALLKTNSRRTATVRSFTYSHLNVLYKKDFEAILLNFPEDAALLANEAKQREQNSANVEKNVQRQRLRQSSRSGSQCSAIPESQAESTYESDYTDEQDERRSSGNSFRHSATTLTSAAKAAMSQEPQGATVAPPNSGKNAIKEETPYELEAESILGRRRSARLSIEGAAMVAKSASVMRKRQRSKGGQVSPETGTGSISHNTILNLDADGEIDLACLRPKASKVNAAAAAADPTTAQLLAMIHKLSNQLQEMTDKVPEEKRRVTQLIESLPLRKRLSLAKTSLRKRLSLGKMNLRKRLSLGKMNLRKRAQRTVREFEH